jgi:hypothetical protein
MRWHSEELIPELDSASPLSAPEMASKKCLAIILFRRPIPK